MRILQVTNSYPPAFVGGAELVTHEHVLALKRLGYECRVFTAEPGDKSRFFEIAETLHEEVPVSRVLLPTRSFSWKYSNFKSAGVEKAFEKVWVSFKPDIVHFHNLPGLSVDLIHIAKRNCLPTIMTAHDYWGFCHRQTITTPRGKTCTDFNACHRCLSSYIDTDGSRRPIAERNAYVRTRLRELDLLLSPSNYLAAQYRAANAAPQGVSLLSNGVDLERFQPFFRKKTSEANVTFGVASYLGKHKGVEPLLKAIAMLPKHTPATFIVAGKGPLEGKIRFFSRWHRNGHMVRFIGPLSPSEMKDFYSGLDVFICPSTWPENQPRTIMEAMACGLSVMATDCGGIPELVRDGVTGVVVPPNSPQLLAAAILRYVSDPAACRTHGQAGRSAIEKHDMRTTVEQLVTLYSSLVERRLSPSADAHA